MKSRRVYKNAYLKKISDFKARIINIQKKSIYTQTAGNCRIYSVLNNLYLNTGLIIAEKDFIDYMKTFWLNTDAGNTYEISAPLLCSFLAKENIRAYVVDVMKETKLFAKLLKNWYSFVYTRDCHDNVLQDIKDNKEIDEIIQSRWRRHAVNITFEKWKLKEYGSWWDYSVYNNFSYGSTDIFIKSIRAGAIGSEVLFLDYLPKQDD